MNEARPVNLWPGLEAYNAALAQGSAQLLPQELAGAKAAVNAWGIPNALSGGFAFIYELTLPSGARRALRLFHTGRVERLDALREAYRAIEVLRRSAMPPADYFVEARWEDACLAAAGRTVPGIVMEWVEAPTLGAWLERHHRDRAALLRIRGKLQELQEALEGAAVVHGDIQTGNIAVRGDLSPTLLDYDGFRLAAARPAAGEEGHIHFRHPDPEGHGPTADRFPFLALDLGLQALAADPSLFARFSEGENVLFKGDDYRSPETSGAFAAMAALPGMGRAAEFFAALCRGAASAVPTVAQFRAAAGLDSATGTDPRSESAIQSAPPIALPSLPVRSAAEGPYLGQYPVLDPTRLSELPVAVGSKVELVGRIVSIKEGFTKYGKPYVFANFGDWRNDGVKLIWWSEGLEAFEGRAPDEAWEGRWVSIMGLVDEPYRNERYGTVQYSLTVLDPSQLRFLSSEEASRRLGRPAFASSAAGNGARGSPRPSNAELPAALNTSPARRSGGGTGTAIGSPSGAAGSPVNRTGGPPAEQSSGGCLRAALWLIGAGLLLLWMLGR